MLFKSFVKDIRPYVAQPPVERLQAELGVDRIYKLASNEGAFGPVPAAVAALTRAISMICAAIPTAPRPICGDESLRSAASTPIKSCSATAPTS